MKFLGELYDNSVEFKQLTENAGIGHTEIALFNKAIQGIGDFDKTTIRFIEVLGENKRFMFIKEIADKYVKLY